MTPRQFLDGFRPDSRLDTGGYFGDERVEIGPGDTVGVVLLHGGGPTGADDVERYLRSVLMDPAAVESSLRPWLREPLARIVAHYRARHVARQYQEVGGGEPLDRHTREQARGVERILNERLAPASGARFRAYVAARHGCPRPEDAARRMEADGVDRVVLLPLFPQYARGTTGGALAYWHALEAAGEIAKRPTGLVREFAAHPLYVRALSERIDEALQRFPRDVRERAHLVFSAHGANRAELSGRRDGYCCLVHATVDSVMRHRAEFDAGRPFHLVFPDRLGPARWIARATPVALDEVAEAGAGAVVVVPVAAVSDQIETAYELDIRVREAALHSGIEYFEVTAGLNCHPLFIEALADCVASRTEWTPGGDGIAAIPRPRPAGEPATCPECGATGERSDTAAGELPAPVRGPAPARAA
jgi:ferrochelatase